MTYKRATGQGSHALTERQRHGVLSYVSPPHPVRGTLNWIDKTETSGSTCRLRSCINALTFKGIIDRSLSVVLACRDNLRHFLNSLVLRSQPESREPRTHNVTPPFCIKLSFRRKLNKMVKPYRKSHSSKTLKGNDVIKMSMYVKHPRLVT